MRRFKGRRSVRRGRSARRGRSRRSTRRLSAARPGRIGFRL